MTGVRGMVSEITAHARTIAGASLWSHRDAEARELVRELEEAAAALDAARLAAIADLDSRKDAVAGVRAGTVAQSFLTGALRAAPARASRDVKAARAAAELPELTAALAAGEIHRDHLDVAVRTLNAIPAALRRENRPKLDAFLLEYSRQWQPTSTADLAKAVLQHLDPEGQDRYDPDAHERRGLWLTEHPDGTLRGTLVVAGLDKAQVLATLAARSAPDPAVKDEQGTLIGDTRTKAQRTLDAFVGLCRCAAGEGNGQVVILTTTDGIATDATTGSPVEPATLREGMCGALFQAVHLSKGGAVLRMGRKVRLATPTQRLAITARDRGCVFPGCGMHAAACHAHHVDFWENGGNTDVENLALVCGRHHRMLHQRHWSLEMIDGVPWVTPPAWVDPQRRPRRNTVHEAHRQARQLALDDPGAAAA